jgi:hypothetical protein
MWVTTVWFHNRWEITSCIYKYFEGLPVINCILSNMVKWTYDKKQERDPRTQQSSLVSLHLQIRSRKKYDVQLPAWFNIYLCLHFVAVIIIYQELALRYMVRISDVHFNRSFILPYHVEKEFTHTAIENLVVLLPDVGSLCDLRFWNSWSSPPSS